MFTGSVSFTLLQEEIVLHCQASAYPNVNNLQICANTWRISILLIIFLICRILHSGGRGLMKLLLNLSIMKERTAMT